MTFTVRSLDARKATIASIRVLPTSDGDPDARVSLTIEHLRGKLSLTLEVRMLIHYFGTFTEAY